MCIAVNVLYNFICTSVLCLQVMSKKHMVLLCNIHGRCVTHGIYANMDIAYVDTFR